MNDLIEVTTINGHVLTLSFDAIESTRIPDPKLRRRQASVRTKSGDRWIVTREEGVRVTMEWHIWADGLVSVSAIG